LTRERLAGPRLLVTGFGPFPGAPENPTAALVEEIASASPSRFGASALKCIVLPTDYRRSWAKLRSILTRFAPDVVVHFGLSRRASAVAVERSAAKRVNPGHLDVSGYVPPSGLARRSGPDRIASTLPIEGIAAALVGAGIPAEVSDDAGSYVCNATLYRSLCWDATASRSVGFIHVPPIGERFTACLLTQAAQIVLRESSRSAQCIVASSALTIR
jgi:pyroglutamyl-peptidase